MEENKTKNRGFLLIIFLIIVILLLSAALVYVIFFSGKDNDGNKKTDADTKQNIEEPRELNKTEISDLMSIIEKYYLRNLSDYYTHKKFTSEADNGMLDLMYLYVRGMDEEAWSKHFDEENEWSFDIEKADKYFKDLYGFKVNEYKDIICDLDKIPLVKYDKANNLYVFNDEHPGHGGLSIGFTDYYVLDSNKTDDKYEISILFLYGNEMDGFYVNGKELVIDFDESIVEPEDYVETYKNYFTNNIDKFKSGKKYTYTFEKLNDKYILKEFNIEN